MTDFELLATPYLVAHGLRALFEGERHIPRVLARELLDEATADWQHVAGLTPRELRKSLTAAKTQRLRS